MSTRDDDGREQLSESLQHAELNDKPDTSSSTKPTDTLPEEPKRDANSLQSPGQDTTQQPTDQEEPKETKAVEGKDRTEDKDELEGLDSRGDTANPDDTCLDKESDWKSKDDEASKEELAKILMQFDPLAKSKREQDGTSTPTVVDRSLDPNNMTLNPEMGSLTPNLSTSASSSPKMSQQLDSPRTSHDVQVAMSEKAKSGSTKKKGESRPKRAVSPDPAKGSDRGATGSSTGGSRNEPPKTKETPFEFQKFMEQMRHRSATPIVRFYQSFLKEFDKKAWTVNEQIKIIHDFLDFIAGKMELCELWKNATDQEFENLKEGMEKLVMNRLFTQTFCPSTTDDAERDEVLSQKIRIFRWIREEHLDIPLTPHNELYLNNAQKELTKINTFKAPRDKVICILNCCKFIFTLIRRSEGNSKGADTFLPILIYVVLRSNPPNLVSNVQYISRFRNPDKLQAEAGYYLASLMGAVTFIENLESGSLSITPEEFDQQIEKTMMELSQEKADAMAAAAPQKQDPPTIGHRKQDSKLATLLAGTAHTKNGRQRPPINEKQFMAAESAQQGSREPKPSSSPSGTSILNPAAALIERGANFATKAVQKPLDLIEKMFQDSGDEQDMAKPYPPRHPPQHPDIPPPLPYRVAQQPQQQEQQQAGGDDGFTEFVYVPAGQQVQQTAPQQPSGAFQPHDGQGYPGLPALRNQLQEEQQLLSQQQQQKRAAEEYQQKLETLADMFPSCDRDVCEAILQANEGRLDQCIENLLEISSTSESKDAENEAHNQEGEQHQQEQQEQKEQQEQDPKAEKE
ncbi:hypothetical protein BGX31_001259 [Mortierella sp. GBA43]|nr:hypothetical protein BGX31_001259 [Mortierella sp. GBA43]